MNNITFSWDTARRFGLHIALAAVLGGLVALPQFLGLFHLPEYVNVFIATACASVAAFVRKQEEEIG